MRRTTFAFALIIVVRSLGAQTTFQITKLQSPYFLSHFGWQMDLGDINGDGALDIVATSPTAFSDAGGVAVAYGPAFTSIVQFGPWDSMPGQKIGQLELVVRDLNADGFDDIVVSGFAGVAVAYGPSLASLVHVPLVPADPGYVQLPGWSLEVMDYTGDGTLDLVVGSPLNKAKGRMDVFAQEVGFDQPPVATLLPQDPNMIVAPQSRWGNGILAADLDQDGSVDLLTAQIITNPPQVPYVLGLLRGGSPYSVQTFQQTTPQPTYEYSEHFRLSDVNSDGIKDLVLGAWTIGNGNKTYPCAAIAYGPAYVITKPVAGPAESVLSGFNRTFEIGDVNRDGNPDIVGGDENVNNGLMSLSGGLRIAYGPDFTLKQDFLGAGSQVLHGKDVSVVDFDHDGFAEILCSAPGQAPGYIHLYHHLSLRSLGATTLSAALGGSIPMEIDCGKLSANRNYVVLVSATGTTPGIDVPYAGGAVHIPLVPDAVTTASLSFVNSPVLDKFQGTLDASGKAAPTFSLGGGVLPPSAVGLALHFAAVEVNANGAISYATHSLSIKLTP